MQAPRAGELQYYTPDSVSFSGGILHITASQQSTVDPKTRLRLQYTSARIQSKQVFLYGHFEFKARLPRGRGLWPALWLRTPPGQPFDGEIDVLEGYGSHPNMIQSTLHPWINGVEPRQYAAWLFVQPKPDSPRFHRPDITESTI
jgi:beta-glucanase (GH16 family)